jgi:hypothetical protein
MHRSKSYGLGSLFLLACSSSHGTSGPSLQVEAGAAAPFSPTEDAGLSVDGGRLSGLGPVPEVAVTRPCGSDDVIGYNKYGPKSSVVGTWDLTSVCAPNMLAGWNDDTIHPPNTLLGVEGKARARWVFTDTTVQRTASWEIVETIDIEKIIEGDSCDQNAPRFAAQLVKEPPLALGEKFVADQVVICKPSTASGNTYTCTCRFAFAGAKKTFEDPAALGYLLSTTGVTTGDGARPFASDATTLKSDDEGLIMLLTRR